MIKIGVSGAGGKMGQRIIDLMQPDKELVLAAALEREGHPQLGQVIENVKISSDPAVLKNIDCLIEFTSPEATLTHLKKCMGLKKPIVIGTTGLSEDIIREINVAAKIIPVLYSPNMSVGVNLLFSLVKQAAEKLKGYDSRIVEAHHVHKKDAPSGTAKKIAEIIKQASGQETRDIRSIREAEIIGDHEVVFESGMDTIKISHQAKTRDIFAQGAILAAKWLAGRKPGLYSMDEVISPEICNKT